MDAGEKRGAEGPSRHQRLRASPRRAPVSHVPSRPRCAQLSLPCPAVPAVPAVPRSPVGKSRSRTPAIPRDAVHDSVAAGLPYGRCAASGGLCG